MYTPAVNLVDGCKCIVGRKIYLWDFFSVKEMLLETQSYTYQFLALIYEHKSVKICTCVSVWLRVSMIMLFVCICTIRNENTHRYTTMICSFRLKM